MKWTLAKKLALICIFFMLLSFLTIFAAGTLTVRRYLLSERVNSMSRACSGIASILTETDKISPLSELSGQDSRQIGKLIRLLGLTDDYTLWIIDTDGKVLASSDTTAGTVVSFNPVQTKAYLRGVYNDYFKQDTISVYTPVITSGSYQPVGYVLLHYPYASLTRSKNTILNRFYLIWCFCVLLWILFAMVLYQIVYRPIRKILKKMQEIAADDAEVDFAIQTSDEIGALSDVLTKMFSRFRTIHEEEQQFISNVSHDLRSPLTSIKGYLEAIQDGTIPPELEGKYLGIVINETNRLTSLTQNLLTLNSLDYKKEQLERTRFDINKVIRQVLLTFEQRCQQKEILFNLTFCEETGFVSADLLKIQQVLYNLIDNAIKFSFQDSVIDISTIQRYGKLFISIRDYGEGIPPESLDKIWNRFYKSDSSRGRDKKGTGLGLAIVRDIINLHGESIHVNSTPGEGSEFIFSLPSV